VSGLNLICDPWLPARRASGAICVVRPSDLTDCHACDPVVALDFPRADWNAAVTEWLIGLMFATRPPRAAADWAAHFQLAPTPASLWEDLAPLAPAFELTGDGTRAFQDPAPLDGDPRPVSNLLIDAPGENTVRRNADLFVRRGAPQTLSLPFAAAALITFQTYAPSGGAGHRTSVRGGGPLTTLVAPVRHLRPTTLWELVWSNVPDRAEGEKLAAPEAALPWLSATTQSAAGQVVGPSDAPAATAFFACPRRIRLEFATGACAWSGRSGPIVIGFRTRPHGANYKGWTHPLSPYRRDAAGKLAAMHPKSETFDMGSFPAWWGFEGCPAAGVGLWQGRREALPPAAAEAEIAVFGYDMDNMKARQWHARQLPWAPFYGDRDTGLRAATQAAATGVETAARSLVHALRLAAYGQGDRGGYSVSPGLRGDAFRAIGQDLRAACEPAFLGLVQRLAQRPGVTLAAGDAAPALAGWRQVLIETTLGAFDLALDAAAGCLVNPARAVAARKMLFSALAADGAVGRALQIDGVLE
jgi:CRISPR system Cascade subunit CasA